RISWAVAFKTAVFMPMAISLFAAGVIWRIMDQQEPSRGALNGLIGAVHDAFSPPGVLADASPSIPSLPGSPAAGTVLKPPVRTGTGAPAATSADPFRKPFGAVSLLGRRLVTPAVMIAYIWVWAGFAMVVIAAGLSAIPRDVLEAARTDGGTEWQVFRRVTVPLLAPVLSVVFITMLINVLKVFDIVLSVAPGSTQTD